MGRRGAIFKRHYRLTLPDSDADAAADARCGNTLTRIPQTTTRGDFDVYFDQLADKKQLTAETIILLFICLDFGLILK